MGRHVPVVKKCSILTIYVMSYILSGALTWFQPSILYNNTHNCETQKFWNLLLSHTNVLTGI